MALGCELMSHVQATSSWLVLLPGFVVGGVGIGITNPVLASGAVSVVPPERSGMSSGAASTFRQVGIATGIAGLGAIFVHQIGPAVRSSLETTPVGRAVVTHGGSSLASRSPPAGSVRRRRPSRGRRPQALLAAYQAGFASTFDHLMAIATVVALVGAVGCLFLVRQKDFVPSHGAGEWKPAVGRVGRVRTAPGAGRDRRRARPRPPGTRRHDPGGGRAPAG